MLSGRHEVLYISGYGEDRVFKEYAALAAACVNLGKQAIILFPDAASLAMAAGGFRGMFGEKLRLYYSGLPAGRRRSAWSDIRAGKSGVVLGLRSAVFAPAPRPGLIIVHREYDYSFKQKQNPRYNAADVAVRRAAIEGFPVLLQGETPSFESSWKIKTEKYRLLSPVSGSPPARPSVRIIDMRGENSRIISRNLKLAAENALYRKKQVLLLLERRGFSNCVACRACGFIARCGNCSVALRYHAEGDKLLCHYCRHAESAKNLCPRCGSGRMVKSGFGTQRVENIAGRLFPGARTARVDSDMAGEKDADFETVEDFRKGNIDILIGTRSVLKFGNFENVHIAGLVSAELFLNLPDFRAAENLFRFSMRAAEKINRAGSLLVQTFNPGHYVMKYMADCDFAGFFAEESVTRKKLGYPPFGHLSNIIFSGRSEPDVEESAENLARLIRERIKPPAGVLGPSPAPLYRIRGRVRWQAAVKSPDWESFAGELKSVLRRAGKTGNIKRNVRVTVDADAVEML